MSLKLVCGQCVFTMVRVRVTAYKNGTSTKYWDKDSQTLNQIMEFNRVPSVGEMIECGGCRYVNKVIWKQDNEPPVIVLSNARPNQD